MSAAKQIRRSESIRKPNHDSLWPTWVEQVGDGQQSTPTCATAMESVLLVPSWSNSTRSIQSSNEARRAICDTQVRLACRAMWRQKQMLWGIKSVAHLESWSGAAGGARTMHAANVQSSRSRKLAASIMPVEPAPSAFCRAFAEAAVWPWGYSARARPWRE